jgi:uncharacterized membrane protein YbhN (UPF0104 family)
MTEEQPSALRKPAVWLWLFAKIIVSVGLLAFLLKVVNWQSIAMRVSSAEILPLVLAVAALICNAFMAAERWRILSTPAGAPMTRWLAVQLTFAGLFFGQVLPGAIGGDAIRGWLGWRAGLPLFGFAFGIVLDRIVSLIASVAMVCLGITVLMRIAPTSIIWAPPAAGGILVLGLIVLLSIDRLPLPEIFRRPPISKVLSALKTARAVLVSRAAGFSYVLAIIIQFSTVTAVFLLARSLNLSVSLLDCIAVVPAIVFLAMLPISLNGWGVREGAMVVGLGLFGVGHDDAVLVSILLGFCAIIASLPGAILWITIRRRQ